MRYVQMIALVVLIAACGKEKAKSVTPSTQTPSTTTTDSTTTADATPAPSVGAPNVSSPIVCNAAGFTAYCNGTKMNMKSMFGSTCQYVSLSASGNCITMIEHCGKPWIATNSTVQVCGDVIEADNTLGE